MTTKQIIQLVVPCLAITSIGLGIVLQNTFEQYVKSVSNTQDANSIVSHVYQRRLFSDEYLVYPGDRAKTQWFAEQVTLERMIGTINSKNYSSVYERELLGKMNESLNIGRSTFTRINQLEDANDPTLKFEIKRLTNQLSITSETTIIAANRLVVANTAATVSALQQMITLLLGAIALIIGLLLGTFTIIWKSISKLEREKSKEEAILSGIGEGLVVTDTEGRITTINQVALKLLQLDSSIIGKNFTEQISLEDDKGHEVKVVDRPLSRTLKSQKPTSTSAYSYVKKDQTKFPTSISISPVKMAGTLLGAVEVFRDITHDKEIDKAKTEFVSLASHQLRTPLSAINWYSEMLLAGDAGPITEMQKKFVQEVYHGSQRMVELVNSLLNVSRIDLGTFGIDPVLTDITEVSESLLGELRSQIELRKLHLEVSYDEDVPSILLDPKLIRIILQNLLSNAVKYTPEGGKIRLGIMLDGKKRLLITVADTGYGIPTSQHDKIFTKLFRADNVMEKDTEGTGLGLYLVKSIIETTGGSITFRSAENKGTTFFVTFPITGMHKKEGSRGLI